MEKPHKIRLHIISPVHIGCDDTYEPTSFVIDTQRKKLIAFDPFEFIVKLDAQQRKRFAEIAGREDATGLIELYKFMANIRPLPQGREIDITEGVFERYLKVLDLPANRRALTELRTFIIPRTSYLPYSDDPYIPGSSLKGSLRTGYLSTMAYSGNEPEGISRILKGEKPEKPLAGWNRGAASLETLLLGGTFDKDPFRAVKVSDLVPHKNVTRRIEYSINRRKSGSDFGKGIPQIVETIRPGSIFEGTINFQILPIGSGIDRPVDSRVFFFLAHRHYLDIFRQELAVVESIGFSLPDLNPFKEILRKKAFLIRIGKHSGAEAVTIAGNRRITIRQSDGKRETDSATTIWLAADKPDSYGENRMAFGWAVVEVV